MDVKEAGKLGGLKTRELYGVEHFKKIRTLSKRKKKNEAKLGA